MLTVLRAALKTQVQGFRIRAKTRLLFELWMLMLNNLTCLLLLSIYALQVVKLKRQNEILQNRCKQQEAALQVLLNC